MIEGKFGTAINCMDGRVQEPVANLLKVRYGLNFVDVVTEAGPVKLLAENDKAGVESILSRVMVSIEKHKSSVVAVAAHHFARWPRRLSPAAPLPGERPGTLLHWNESSRCGHEQ